MKHNLLEQVKMQGYMQNLNIKRELVHRNKTKVENKEKIKPIAILSHIHFQHPEANSFLITTSVETEHANTLI